jgi:crotonobetainyl-CoA:carnitine CoA-transferase CaiB-like acyl-CoA transferase
VIKLEPPAGDPSRSALPRHEGHSLYFTSHNRRKKSVVVDLKSPGGRDSLARFLNWADVVVTNYSPEAAAGLGLDFASASAVNPRIVVLHITGYGLDGSDAFGAFDGTIQARSGIADLIGAADGPPTVTAIPIIDHLAAIDAAYAVCLALRKRDATGAGVSVDVALFDVATSILAYAYGDVLVRGTRPQRNGSRAPYAFTTTYQAADGHVFIAPMGSAMWSALSEIVGHPEWAAPDAEYLLDPDARIRDRALIEPQIEAWTRLHDRADIIAALSGAGIACGPVNRIDEAINDPIVAARGMVQWITAGDPPVRIPVPGIELKVGPRPDAADTPRVPDLGTDTTAVFQQLGFDLQTIDDLRAAGAIGS